MNWPAALVVADGTGAPVRKKRAPIGAPNPKPGTEPGFGKGFVPVNAVLPPPDARYAYCTAPLISAASPLARGVLMKVTCGAVKFLNVTLPRRVIGIVATPPRPCDTLLVKNAVS